MAQAGTADAATTASTHADATAAGAAAVDAAAASAAAEDATFQEAGLKASESDIGSRADEQPDVKLPNAEEEVSVLEASTPAVSASGVREATTARKSGSQTWFGKAGGLLGRWTVPVKVKKEPRSKHLGATAVIDLT